MEMLIQDGGIEPDFTWKINRIKDKLEQETFELMCERVFKWKEYPVEARAVIECGQDSWVYMSMCIQNNNKHKVDTIRPIPEVYYVLRDQSGSRKHKFSCSRCPFRTTFSEALTFRILLNFSTEPLYVVEDAIVVEIYVEPPWMSHRVFSYNGCLVWQINNYRKWIEGRVSHHKCPYFYTGPRGYRVGVTLSFDGQWLMASVTCLNGNFDENLSPNFPHRITVTLLNRKEPDKNVEMKVVENGGKFFAYSFGVCNEEAIENVVENDTIYYTIAINRVEEEKKSRCFVL